MTLRIGFDMDGVLADFALAYHVVETRLFGSSAPTSAGDPEAEDSEPAATEKDEASDAGKSAEPSALELKREARALRRRRDAVWQAIRETPNFWMTLKPTDARAVSRIHEMMLRHKWEVFFITQRPATAGETVQRQTQHWLVTQGFDLPSVLVIHGSRGAAAGALRLDYHVDDSPNNCVDVQSESSARPILLLTDAEDRKAAGARRLGIGTARSIGEALDVLERVTVDGAQPTLFARIATMVGWRA